MTDNHLDFSLDLVGRRDAADDEVAALEAEAAANLARRAAMERRRREAAEVDQLKDELSDTKAAARRYRAGSSSARAAKRNSTRLAGAIGVLPVLAESEAAAIAAELRDDMVATGGKRMDPMGRRVSLRVETLFMSLADSVERSLRRAADFGPTSEHRQRELAAATKLANAAANLAGAIPRLRGSGSQTVRVERVVVEAGAQAIVGAVARSEGGGG